MMEEELLALNAQIDITSVRWKAVSDKLEKSREDLSKTTSEVTCMDFEIMKKESTCRKMLEEEIPKLINEKVKWQLAVDQAKCELDDLNTKFRTSQESNKMTACVQIEELALSPSLQVEIDAREKTIKQLTEKKTALTQTVRGTSLVGKDVDTVSLLTSCNVARQSIKQREEQIAEQDAAIAGKRQQLRVLRKRNEAQLIRIRRQLKETQSRQHELSEEAQRLQRALLAAHQ